MTFVVGKDCINCKHTTCVQVCPVDCFYEGKNILVIDPEECIDCGLCEPECPVDAIITDYEDKDNKWYDLNYKWSNTWPNISQKREEDVPADAKEWEGVEGKIKYFSENPGKGD